MTPRSALIILFVLLSALALAQTRDTANVRGRVVDPTGSVIPGVQVTVANQATGFTRTANTDSQGDYIISGLPLTGQYTITAEKSGFARARTELVTFRAGQTAIFDYRLGLAGVAATVSVFGTTESVAGETPQMETRLGLEKVNETPVLGRRPTALVLLDSAARPARGTGDLYLGNPLFVINGSGRRQTTYAIDNSTGDDSWGRQTLFTNLPLSSIQEFTILTNAWSAEYGRSTGAAVNVVTKSGTNAYHGDISGLWRPSSLEANAPLVRTVRAADSLWQGSGAISGPLVQDRTYFMFAGEYDRQRRDSAIGSPKASGVFGGEFREAELLARLDHRLTQNHLLMARINFDRFSDTNPSDTVGGLNLATTARTFHRRTYTAQLSETATVGNSFVNEARLQMQVASPIAQFTPVVPSTQFTQPGVATWGESRSSELLNHQYQAADTVSLNKGKHSLKLGADVIYSSTGGFGQEFGGGFLLGQFRVKPAYSGAISGVTINDVNFFQQSFGNLNYHVGETLWALFAQDNVNITPDLTLSLGLRYERQTFTDAARNFSPRVGFAYRLPGTKATVIHGGYGLFYSEMRANTAAGWYINGPEGVITFSAAPGQFGFPTTLSPIAGYPAGLAVPARDLQIRPGRRDYYSRFFDVGKLKGYPDALLNPYTQQWNLGVEREIGSGWSAQVDYVGQHTIRVERPLDLNSPAPFIRTAPGQVRSAAAADATRPIVPVPNGYKRIVTTVNNGSAIYHALQANLRKRLTGHFSALLSYTYSNNTNTVDPDIPSQDPNEPNLTGRDEYAASVLNQRHRASLSGWYTLPLEFTVGSSVQMASGRPYNVVTGVDNNGDGSTADRPVVNGVVVPRNAARGTATYDVGAFVEKSFRLGERVKLGLRAESFNLLNHANIVGRNTTWGNAATPNASFGQPLAGSANVDPARQWQFVMRMEF